jgi:phage baseplate assembly protein W
MSADLVGSGWAFPGSFTPTGTVALATGTRELDGAIRMIVGTAPGQRLMRPEFGCAIYDYIFDPLTPRTLGLVELAVREALLRWEPRIELETVVATVAPAQEGVVDLEVGYRVKATNDHRNLVFPFYVIPREVVPQEVVPLAPGPRAAETDEGPRRGSVPFEAGRSWSRSA